VQGRAQKLVEARERQVCLGLHARGRQRRHSPFGRASSRSLEKRRLSDACLAAEHERAAALTSSSRLTSRSSSGSRPTTVGSDTAPASV
jgi:hypothetical protein